MNSIFDSKTVFPPVNWSGKLKIFACGTTNTVNTTKSSFFNLYPPTFGKKSPYPPTRYPPRFRDLALYPPTATPLRKTKYYTLGARRLRAIRLPLIISKGVPFGHLMAAVSGSANL